MYSYITMSKRGVLIIDDDLDVRQRLDELVLAPNGYQSILAQDGGKGIQLALRKSPDIILLSSQLPDMKWTDVLRTLRQKGLDIPIILTTAYDSKDLAVKSLRLGVCDYVSKPCDPQTMKDALQRAKAVSQSHEKRKQLTNQLREANEQLQQRLQELNAIHAIGRASTSLMDLGAVLDRITEIAAYMTGSTESILLLLDSESDELYLRAAKGLGNETIENLRLDVGSSAAGQAIRTGRPVHLTGEEAEVIPVSSAQALLYVPLRTPERGTIGVLGVVNQETENAFQDEQDVMLLMILADYGAIAIENAELFQRVSNAKDLMDNVFASIDSGVITIDAQDRITLLNQTARQILSFSKPAAGSPLADALPALANRLHQRIERVKESKEPVGPLEIELTDPGRGNLSKMKNAGLRNFRINLSPLKNSRDEMQGVSIVIDDLTEQRRLEARYQLFQRYLSPAVIERLPNDPYELKLGGQRQEITCLFADLRGFTDFSLRHTPETLVEVLNQYLAVGTNAILAEEGTLDKFMGDAIVAFFNAPLPQEDHTLRALRAALKIREEIARLHKRLVSAYRLSYGIGISVGESIVGNVGTPQRLDYTAIGPTVNLAYRLQEATEPEQILITSEVYQRVQEQIKTRPISLGDVQGFDETIKVYELIELL